jgi:hypothetical protein
VRQEGADRQFGLPQKGLYTTGDLCSVLGVSWDRVRRMIQRGHLPESKNRDANGHRGWTAEEMRRRLTRPGRAKNTFYC